MSDAINFHYTEPILNLNTETAENGAAFSVKQYYINNSNENVVVVLRNNLPIICNKNNQLFTGARYFIIRTVYHFKSFASIIDTINYINEVINAHGETKDLVIIKNTLINAYDTDRNCGNVSLCIDRRIDILEIKSNGSTYIPEADLLLQYNKLDVTIPHPFSKNGHAIAEYHKVAEEKKVTGIFIELIDNENNIDKRYMYVANQVMEIPVTKDKTKQSGVYFTKAVNNKFNDVHIKPEFYSFDQAIDYLGLYKTQEEAKTGGDPKLVSKARLTELEQNLADLKHNNQVDQINKQAIISNLNIELEKAKAEAIRAKQEAEINKHKRDDFYDTKSKERDHYYESRSYERKDTHEMIKYIPGIVLGVIGAIAYTQTKK
jgi:hypothetical protein